MKHKNITITPPAGRQSAQISSIYSKSVRKISDQKQNERFRILNESQHQNGRPQLESIDKGWLQKARETIGQKKRCNGLKDAIKVKAN
jgi:hypothetical protein